ncbi:MAG: DUF692 domain-containing protein [Nannocystaceae bacterium]
MNTAPSPSPRPGATSIRGVGIGLRRPHYTQILEMTRQVDWLEIIPENFIGYGGRQRDILARCRERWPIVSHGVSMSIGGPDPIDPKFLDDLRELLNLIDPPYFTDHMCFSAIGGVNFYDLLPLPRTEEAVRHAAKRARGVAEHIERPLALENISYYASMPGSEMSEGAFLTRILEEANCGLMLDVNNVYVNAVNHREDPLQSLCDLPLARTCQIHLAGHVRDGDVLLDNHGAPVIDEVWALYREALQRVGPVPTLIEWDTHIPELDVVLDQADRAREIMREVCGPESAP